MNRKDIALTVGGVLASMVVAYLIYKMERRDAKESKQGSDNGVSQAESYAVPSSTVVNLPSIQMPTLNIPSSSISAPSEEHTAPGPTPEETLLGSILGTFSGSISQQQPQSTGATIQPTALQPIADLARPTAHPILVTGS